MTKTITINNRSNILNKVLVNEDLMQYNNLKHAETYNHLVRCSMIAEEFGKFINLSQNEINTLIQCALFHDLGKFEIDTSVLYKTMKLSDCEFSLIKNHVNYNCSTIDNEFVLNCIKYHHQRPDGKGYIKNIDYSKLPLYTKIMSLIDTYDVMTNKRSYKKYTFSIEQVQEEIRNNLNKQFDNYYGNLFISFLDYKRNISKGDGPYGVLQIRGFKNFN